MNIDPKIITVRQNVRWLPADMDTEEEDDRIRVAVIGKPNAGKSSLVNRILGDERMIVSNIPGTTRDIVEETVNLGDVILRLADTAGIRECLRQRSGHNWGSSSRERSAAL